jgi:hypothetical protein
MSNDLGLRYDTVEEYDTAIASVRAAITRQEKIGSHYGNKHGGSERVTTEPLLKDLYAQLNQLVKERNLLDTNAADKGVIMIGAAW